VFRPIEAGLPKPDEKFGFASGQNQERTTRFEPLSQIAQGIQCRQVNSADGNGIHDEPPKSRTRLIGKGQHPRFEMIGIEESERSIETIEHQPRHRSGAGVSFNGVQP
jgi:hypothetical protein